MLELKEQRVCVSYLASLNMPTYHLLIAKPMYYLVIAKKREIGTVVTAEGVEDLQPSCIGLG